MLEINGYQIISEVEWVQFGECATFWECEKDNTRFNILTIKLEEGNHRLLERLLRADIKPLINGKVQNIQNVIEADRCRDGETEYIYIVYEDISGYKPLEKDNSNAKLSVFKDILTALNDLKI